MTNSQEIMVSICCITYNQKEYIRDALEGFLRQKTDFAGFSTLAFFRKFKESRI